MEDFYYGSKADQDEIFEAFMGELWKHNKVRRFRKKYYDFEVMEPVAGTPAGSVFEKYNHVEYYHYVSFIDSDNCYDMIKQKINNLYAYYADERYCKNAEYYKELRYPKDLYFRYREGKIDAEFDLEKRIKGHLLKATALFERNKQLKINISWAEYKKIIKEFLWNIFCNYVPAEERDMEFDDSYSKEVGEDHPIIKYINDSLKGKMQNYQKNHYNVPIGHGTQYSRCHNCGALIVQNAAGTRLYCPTCAAHLQREAVRTAQNYQGDTVRYGHCARCGKQIVQNKNGDRKYCDECAAEIHRDEMRSGRGYIGDEVKHGTCVECGAEITYEKNASRKYCDDCARKIKNKQNRESRARLKALVD